MAQKYEKRIKILEKEKVKLDEPMANHTTFKIGGPADLYFETETETELVKVLEEVRKLEIPYFILGGGSNILVGDKGFRGIIIKVQSSKLKVQSYNSPKELLQNSTGQAKFKITVGAGVPLSVIVNESLDNSLTGLEFAAGIPGTVGGAIRGNAGAWQGSISDIVLRVKILDGNGEVSWLDKEDCGFGYRQSRFKTSKEIILEAELVTKKGNKEKIEWKVRENLEKRSCQPKEPSAGCIFVNPKPQSAGEMIEQCGLKGTRVGNAQISKEHANFIVNLGGAKAADVIALINLTKEKVKEKFGLDLQEEIVRIGEF